MAPLKALVNKPTEAQELILEAWSQGFMIGALIIMAGITISNMRRGVLLHKLILIEVASIPSVLVFTLLTTWFDSSSSACRTAPSSSPTLRFMRGTSL
jgi:hypothetical protein